MRHSLFSIPVCLAMVVAHGSVCGAQDRIQAAVAGSSQHSSSRDAASPGFYFGVLGQVANPAVYQFPNPTVTLTELVSAAGGITERASGNARLIRCGLNVQQRLIMPGNDAQVMPGDIVVFDERPASGVELSNYSPGNSAATGFDANGQPARVQVAFVGLMDRPVIVKMPADKATVPQIALLLRQSPEVAKAAHVIQTRSTTDAVADGSANPIQLTSGSIVVFDRNLVATDCIPEGLPAAVNAAAPPSVGGSPNTTVSGQLPQLSVPPATVVNAMPISSQTVAGNGEAIRITPHSQLAAAPTTEHGSAAGEPAAWSPISAPALSATNNDTARDAESGKASTIPNQPLPTFGEQLPATNNNADLPDEIPFHAPAPTINANPATTQRQGATTQFDPFTPIPYNADDEQPAAGAPLRPTADAAFSSHADTLSTLPSEEFHPAQSANSPAESAEEHSSADTEAAPAKKTRAKAEKKSWLRSLGIPMDLTIVGILGTLAAVVALGVLGHTTQKQHAKAAATTTVTTTTATTMQLPTPIVESIAEQPKPAIVVAETSKSELYALECLIKNELPIVEEPCLYKPKLTFFGRATSTGKARRIDAAHGVQQPIGAPQAAPKTEKTTNDRTAAAKTSKRDSGVRAPHASIPVAAAGRSLLERVLSNIHGAGTL